MVVDVGLTAGSTVFESPEWGGDPYASNVFVGPSFEKH
jgi:hypothetical protein